MGDLAVHMGYFNKYGQVEMALSSFIDSQVLGWTTVIPFVKRLYKQLW